MTTRQTPDAVREASWTGDPHKLAAALRRVASVFDPKRGFRLPQLLRDAADEIDCLAALDSRAGDAVEGLERLRPMLENATWNKYPSAPDVPENWSLSIDNNRELAGALLNMLPALLATPVPAFDAECPSSPDGRHQVDTSMESGPNICFHCEVPMGGRHAQ